MTLPIWVRKILHIQTERDEINEWCDRMANIDQEAERTLEKVERRKAHRERADQLRQERQQRLERTIDREVADAEEVYKQCKRQADPYAMHKAIESLSLAVMTTFANARATEMLDTIARMAEQRRVDQEAKP